MDSDVVVQAAGSLMESAVCQRVKAGDSRQFSKDPRRGRPVESDHRFATLAR